MGSYVSLSVCPSGRYKKSHIAVTEWAHCQCQGAFLKDAFHQTQCKRKKVWYDVVNMITPKNEPVDYPQLGTLQVS